LRWSEKSASSWRAGGRDPNQASGRKKAASLENSTGQRPAPFNWEKEGENLEKKGGGNNPEEAMLKREEAR